MYTVLTLSLSAVVIACASPDAPTGGFRPPRRGQSLLNVGTGTAVASWGTIVVRASWAMWRTDRIDRQFITRFAP